MINVHLLEIILTFLDQLSLCVFFFWITNRLSSIDLANILSEYCSKCTYHSFFLKRSADYLIAPHEFSFERRDATWPQYIRVVSAGLIGFDKLRTYVLAKVKLNHYIC
jgi:hypothetical protein